MPNEVLNRANWHPLPGADPDRCERSDVIDLVTRENLMTTLKRLRST